MIEIVFVDAIVLAKYDRNILKVLNTQKKDNPHEAYFGLNMTEDFRNWAKIGNPKK